jgi:hypothetical protein
MQKFSSFAHIRHSAIRIGVALSILWSVKLKENTTFEETIAAVEEAEEAYVEEIEFEDDEPVVSIAHGTGVPTLSIKEAALILGKSIRALERSLSGKWGNRLPDGWSATRKMINGKEEWQIAPPPGFRYEHLLDPLSGDSSRDSMSKILPEDLLRPLRAQFELANTAELAGILRELAQAHRELADQRKMHLEDLRTLLELQGSMRLIEVNASETAKLRTELLGAQKDLIGLRDQYKALANLPWWKRIFKRF